MTMLEDFKNQYGIKTVSVGKLNREAISKKPSNDSSAEWKDPLDGITVTEEYEKIKCLLEACAPFVFVNGKAGTGKSTLIHYLRHTLKKNVVVVAPTGVAALTVEGATVNSYFRFPPRIITDDDIKKVEDRKLYSRLDLLIVDEISMVRADMIDAMDKFLRLNGRVEGMPFGGTQLLFVGDMFQLPPVITRADWKILVKMGYESPYFFSAKVMEDYNMSPVELTEIFRQRDSEFTGMLNHIREGKNLDNVVPEINAKCSKEQRASVITLTCTNAVADQINRDRLEQLSGISKTFRGEIKGKFNVEEEKLPSPLNLEVKAGAQVMFTKNAGPRQWVNGTLGTVVSYVDDVIRVAITGDGEDRVVDVRPVKWESYRYRFDKPQDKIVPEVAGSYTQFPLMLAWAVTIHKSQGKTLEKVRVDLGSNAFASGQVYVAMSRCRSLEDISLARPIEITDVKCDPVILRFNDMLTA